MNRRIKNNRKINDMARKKNKSGAIKCFKNILKVPIVVVKGIGIWLLARKKRKQYDKIIAKIRRERRTKLEFAAYVVFDSTYGMDGSFRIMQSDLEHWNPHIVVIPDISRGYQHAVSTYKKTKAFFVNRYGEDFVLDGWNIEKNEYYDHLDHFDIVYYANPYDSMVHDYHKITYACKKDVLPIYVSYGYDIGRYTTLSRLRGKELNFVWKLFADTTYTFQDYLKHQIVKGKNVVLAGYSKMDELYKFVRINENKNNKKKILITPHHTVCMDALPLSNFMSYYDLIAELPILFPNIDFVFRPHPLLFTTIINNNLWTQDEVNEYIDMLIKRGIEYSVGGDYLELFAKCDAIINDCGSFTVEWLFTGKPGCFVYSDELRTNHLTNLMNMAIEKYTIARSKHDIISFVEDIMNDNYVVSHNMSSWMRNNIALNYPNVSEFIVKEINILGNKDL